MRPFVSHLARELYVIGRLAHERGDAAELGAVLDELRRRDSRGAEIALRELSALRGVAPAATVAPPASRAARLRVPELFDRSPGTDPPLPTAPTTLPAFVMPLMALPRPVQLLHFARTVGIRGPMPLSSALDTARALVKAGLRGERPTVASYGIVRALLYLLDELQAAEARVVIAVLVLGYEKLQVRELFVLWQDVRQVRQHVARRLAPLVCGTDDGTEMPEWLPRVNAAQTEAVLATPARAFVPWLTARKPRITELDDVLGVIPHSAVATELVDAAIVHATDEVWRAFGRPHEVREWSQTRSMRVQACVADRQLTMIGQGVEGPAGLPTGTETENLQQWVLAKLGMPEDFPARWEGVSDRAKEIFEWLHVRDELLKILEQFAREAEQSDRGQFWREEAFRIRDARFVKNDEMAICILVVGGHLVVEFGQTGNAAYIYGVPVDAPKLRRLRKIPDKASDFKHRDSLNLGGLDLEFVARVIHRSGWQGNVRQWFDGPRKPYSWML